MTLNFDNLFNKNVELSANSREVSRFQAPDAQEANYFTQLAQQHKAEKELALHSYLDTLGALESLVESNQADNKTDVENRKATLRQKADQYKSKADQADALARANERQALFAQDKDEPSMSVPKQQETAKKGSSDQLSQSAVDEFSSIVANNKMTAAEISEAYLRCSRQISINSPDAWSSIDREYSNALAKAFTPDNTMDAQSKNAIANFKTAINPGMTKDEMMETFVRFSREVSIKYPEAWNELQSILSNSLPDAYKPDTSMDAQSRNAISDFKSALNSGMTAQEMDEMFVRFSRQVSVQYPEASNELQTILNNALPTAFKVDTTMDAQSRNAITNFKATINENFTKPEMVEMFLRFSREVSAKFPDAAKDLESILNQNLPNAFKHNTKSDPQSELAVNNFKQSIQESHTQDELVEMFLRFSRDVSIKYPDKKNELLSALNNALPNAFKPDTTIDKDSQGLVDDFKSIIHYQDMDKESFKETFANYFNQIGLNLTKARGMMNEVKAPKFRESEMKTEGEKIENDQAGKLNHLFNALVNDVNKLDNVAQIASTDLKGLYNLDDQNKKIAEIENMQADKTQKDDRYFALMTQINGNTQAVQNIHDNYLAGLNVDKSAPDKKEMLQQDTKKLSDFEMMRHFRREDIKDLINDTPKEQLAEILYNVPKYQLINGLTLLPHEQQIEALTTNRFEDALLRDMPRKELIQQLPDAYEMLPILMMLGKTDSGFKNGAELIEDTIIGDYKVEEKQNDTRTQEELLPYMMEQLLNKTPRQADAKAPVLGQMSPVKAQIQNFKEQGNADLQSGQQQHQMKATKVEELMPEQLRELAQEAMQFMGEDDQTAATAAKRGDSKDMMNFLQDMKKVDSVDAGKMAMSNLYNSQAQGLKDTVLPRLGESELLKINKFYGRDPKDMMKQMPGYVVSQQLHELNKVQLVESYKKVDKEMIMNRLQTLPSQVLAKSALDVVNREQIYNLFANKEGIAA
jgi:hypothetical protein